MTNIIFDLYLDIYLEANKKKYNSIELLKRNSYRRRLEMVVLVIVGSDLLTNSSANLCHKAYIQGLLDNGCSVDVVMVGEKSVDFSTLGFNKDDPICFYCYKMDSFYEKVSKFLRRSKKGSKKIIEKAEKTNIKQKKSILFILKKWLHSLYGPYEVYIRWKKNAMQFHSNKVYDLMISLSFPPVSHLLASELINNRHIKSKRWIQIWEDPWCLDLVFRSLNDSKTIKKAQVEEARLLKMADKVLYVSPITLIHQSKMFSESQAKMFWMPVPTYYTQETIKLYSKKSKIFGYFGDYSTQIRNLRPFYEAAKIENAKVNICGYSDKIFDSCENITVRPRLSLAELFPIENQTNVLVFLSNLCGGQIPGKIYQYSSTNKTILFILDGTDDEKAVLKKIFGKYNRYVFCDNNVEDICRAIKKIQNNEIDEKYNIPLKCFSPKNVVEKILKHMEG